MRAINGLFALLLTGVTILSFVVGSGGAACAQEGFDSAAWGQWKQGLKADVIKKGISPENAERIIDHLNFDPDVLDKDGNQPTKRFTYPEYKKRAVSDSRIENGRKFYSKHYGEIEQYAARYDVPAPVIVALLGMETDYGGYTGTYDILDSLATLAYASTRESAAKQADRRRYFRNQIYYAIKMLDEGIIERERFKGSWAGAFGINQHMPESFFSYVIDGDEDGDRDILDKDDLSDVFATTAHHLRKVGWKNGVRWGREVSISQVKTPYATLDSWSEDKVRKPLQVWAKMGITLPNGDPLPVVAGMEAALILSKGGPAYLVYDNFFSILKWNNSRYFGLAVGELSDAIQAGP